MIIILKEQKKRKKRVAVSGRPKVEKKVSYKCPYVDICEHAEKETCYSVKDRNLKTEVCFRERKKVSPVNLDTGRSIKLGTFEEETDNAVEKLMNSGNIQIFKLY